MATSATTYTFPTFQDLVAFKTALLEKVAELDARLAANEAAIAAVQQNITELMSSLSSLSHNDPEIPNVIEEEPSESHPEGFGF